MYTYGPPLSILYALPFLIPRRGVRAVGDQLLGRRRALASRDRDAGLQPSGALVADPRGARQTAERTVEADAFGANLRRFEPQRAFEGHRAAFEFLQGEGGDARRQIGRAHV